MSRVIDVRHTASTPFRRLVAVELRKSYDTRAGFWLLTIIGVLVLLAESVILAITATRDQDVSFGDFVGAAASVTSIFLPVLGILLVTSEWGQRTALVTFALEPRRRLVLHAKLATGLLLTLFTASVTITVGLVCNLLSVALQGHGSWAFGWNQLLGLFIVQSLAMAGGFAFATLFLNTPAALVVFFLNKWVLPGLLLAGAGMLGWFDKLAPWINFQAAQAPIADMTLNTLAEWSHLAVTTCLWLLLPLAIGTHRILRAELK